MQHVPVEAVDEVVVVVAPKDLVYGLARMFSMIDEQRHRNVHVVRTIAEAYRLLEVDAPGVQPHHGPLNLPRSKTEEGNCMADEIVIPTQSSNDITLKEAEEMAEVVRGLNLNCDVRVKGAEERTGLGITWFEILRISFIGGALWLGKMLTEDVIKRIAEAAVDWARARFKGRKSGSKRPVYVAIYGPDGLVKSVVIKNATDEPEDRTEEDQRLARTVREKK